VRDQFRQPARVGGDRRHSARHRLQGDETEAFLLRRQKQQIGERENLRHFLLFSEEHDAVPEAEFHYLRADDGQIRPFADEQQTGGQRLIHLAEHLDDVADPFDRPEVRNVHQNFLVRRGVFGTQHGTVARVVFPLIHKIVGQVDRPLDLQERAGFPNQIAGHRGHRVAFVDRETDQVGERRFLRQNRDVRTVQRRHDLEMIPDHLAGEKRAHRVRQRIVDMQHIQLLHAGDRRHLAGQREIVRRMPEHVIIGHFHFVKKNVSVKPAEAKRNAVGDKMHLVAAFGQQFAEFGRDDAGTAERRVAGDADFELLIHALFLHPEPVDQERHAAGESFRICDGAKLPEQPVAGGDALQIPLVQRSRHPVRLR